MFVVEYKETYSKTYTVSEKDAKTADDARAYIEGMIRTGALDGPDECVGSCFSVGQVPDSDISDTHHKVGGVYEYSFGDENKSKAIVEIIKLLDGPRKTAEVRFVDVLVDDSGNGFFSYLERTGGTMIVSRKYLHEIT